MTDAVDADGNAGVDAYLAEFTGAHRALMDELRALIGELVPEASEKISYGMPTFDLNGNLVHFAGFTRHVGLFPGPEGVSHVAEDLGDLKHSKGTIQLRLDRPLPRELITRVVEFRAAQQRAKRPRR